MRFPLLLVSLLPLFRAQHLVTTSVDNVGNTFWSATAGAPKTSVRALPSIPTLVYNCAIVPALCNNVAQLRPGAQLGGHNEVFGWDPDEKRKERRNRGRCPASWKTQRGVVVCPKANQPPIHPLGITDDVPPLVDADDLAIFKRDTNGQEVRTGLMMSCNEFPPAMSIQGGIGPKGSPPNGRTYCVPSKCFFISFINLHTSLQAVYPTY